MNYFENNKRYLDAGGLKALILKIKEIYDITQENAGAINGLNTDLAELIERVDGHDVNISDINAAIAAIRAEIGESTDATAQTIYARLTELEAEAADYEARITELENNAFQKVESSYDVDSKKVTMTFTNGAGDEVGTAEIDTTDFVVDGMIEDVYMSTLGADGKFYISVNHPGADTGVTTEVLDTELVNELSFEFLQAHAGHKFIIMRFKTSSNGVEGIKDVLLEADQLFQDYTFSAEGVENYIDVVVSNTASTENTGAQAVKYTISMGAKLVKDLELVEGVAIREYESDGTTVKSYFRGIEKLNEELDEAQSNIADLQDSAADADERITALEETVDGTEAEGYTDGLVSRTAAIETWIDDQSIDVDQLNAVFNKIVYGQDMPEASYDWFDPAELA